MIELLLVVIICGIAAWVLTSTQMPQPFMNIGIAILVLIVVLAFFNIVFGVGPRFPLTSRG